MNNAPIQSNGMTVPDKEDHKPGKYVESPRTFAAEVLAALLEGKELTEYCSGPGCRVYRAVYTLEHHYGWPINRRDFVIYVEDGQQRYGQVYWLSSKVIARARENGADYWARLVRVARYIMNVGEREMKDPARALDGLLQQLRRR